MPSLTQRMTNDECRMSKRRHSTFDIRHLTLVAILGACLTAVAAADPADYQSDDRDPAPPLPSAIAGGAPSGPNAGYSVTEDVSRSTPATSATPAPAAEHARSGSAAELAPDPRPDSRSASGSPDRRPAAHRDAAPAVFQEEADSLAARLAAAREPVTGAKNDTVEGSSSGPGNVLRMPPKPPPDAPRTPVPPAARASARPSASLAPAAAIAPRAAAPSLPLGGRAEKGPLDKASPISALCTVGGSLSVVLGLFLVVAWAMRKVAPRGALVLPKEVFEILGRAPLGARQQVQLLRCGSKLLLVSITPHGVETLTEVTDAVEVDRIAGVCQQGNPKSSTTAFRQIFQQVAAEERSANGSGKPAATDDLQPSGLRRKRYRWEEKHA